MDNIVKRRRGSMIKPRDRLRILARGKSTASAIIIMQLMPSFMCLNPMTGDQMIRTHLQGIRGYREGQKLRRKMSIR